MKIHLCNNKFLGLSTLLLAATLLGCSGPLLEITLVDQRTALENQVLGSYTQLNQDVMLLSSVRGIDSKGQLIKRQPLPATRERVVRAMQRAAFNKDDLEQYKQMGILGENNQGGVTLLASDKLQADSRPFVENLLTEENADRETVMLRIIETDENLSLADLPRVRKIFAAMNRDKAPTGTLIQTEDGKWQQKGVF